MAAAARHGNLEIRLAEEGIENSDGQGERGGTGIAARRAIELLRPPGRIAQQVERLTGENRRNLMVPVPVGRRPGEYRDDDLRPEPPDHIHHVFQNRVARPEPERFFDRLREAEIVGTREELARAVELTRGEQLFGANDAELGAKLGTDEVLAAF